MMAASQSLVFQEYQLISTETTKLFERRQSLNNTFSSLNVVFLAGFLFPLIHFQINSYIPAILSSAVAAIALILNDYWFRNVRQIRLWIKFRTKYLRRLEEKIRGIENAASQAQASEFGIYHFEEKEKQIDDPGFTKIENGLYAVNFIIYIGVALLGWAYSIAVLNYGVAVPLVSK